MPPTDRTAEIVQTWRLHARMTLDLVRAIPAPALAATARGPRSRTVAQVFAHLHHVRYAWLRYMAPAAVATLPRFPPRATPSPTELARALRASSRAVEHLLRDALAGRCKIRSFKRQPVRWMAYLISHESHHRGQILLTLKLTGYRVAPDVAIRSLWQKWYWGKE